jgi:hypothetical protein
VYQSHLNKVKFWIIEKNITNYHNFIIDLCKNLLNRRSNHMIYMDIVKAKIKKEWVSNEIVVNNII